MPWSVLPELERARRHARESSDRIPGACHDTIASLITQASALARRRGTDDMATVAALITDSPHCVPCITLITQLDARRVYTALERLRMNVNVQLLSARCVRCARATTVHAIQP
jgi:hypothetical protein